MKTETREWIEGIKVYLEMQKKLKAGVVELCNMYVQTYPDEARKVHVYQDIEKLAEELCITELEVERDEDGNTQEVYFMFENIMFFQLVYALPKNCQSTISLKEFKLVTEKFEDLEVLIQDDVCWIKKIDPLKKEGNKNE